MYLKMRSYKNEYILHDYSCCIKHLIKIKLPSCILIYATIVSINNESWRAFKTMLNQVGFTLDLDLQLITYK